ncbi:lipid II:glycine glycyltransferase FemX [Dictyobacter aurantiacus]|uniref:Methicillin resistance protein n=1 Tax=Dictyobacter aurantiacus TaxID=1936993 RepID=A0A401ZQ64_9CHLR|nr:peptidoglycan bridge formation glycyltransferase FemA/FemB family protein [Dictyobacter aurantiacus]GCE08896.1 methicillin resistance protein [Dictyobacter aurantiacus]
MKAKIITDRQQWNDFIASSGGCNITQTYEWGELLATNNRQALPIGVINAEGKLCAAILILIARISLLPFSYFYAPRGPVIDDPTGPAMDILLACVEAEARKHHAFMLKIEPGIPEQDQAWQDALKKAGFCTNPEARHLRHEWVLDIRPEEAELLAGMRKTWRYCIRLASRRGVQVRSGQGRADLDTFYQLLRTTSERDHFFIYGKDFYARLLALYGERARLLIAEHEGKALGAALLIAHGRWCWYMYGASSNEQRERMPNHLLQWNAFQWAKQQGCWYYNFRGIPDQLKEGQPMWGVYVFKSGFGGYPMRAIETHDLPYNITIYQMYRTLLKMRSWYSSQKELKRSTAITDKPTKERQPAERVTPAHRQTTAIADASVEVQKEHAFIINRTAHSQRP